MHWQFVISTRASLMSTLKSRSQVQVHTSISVVRSSLEVAVLLWIVGTGKFFITANGLPFPAPNFKHCNNSERCCTPTLGSGPVKKFQFQSELPMRIRPAAQLVDDEYVAKFQKAYKLLRNLPDSDGRSYMNQAFVHCLYCDNHLYFPGHEYPLEIHNSWLFLPWHRLYLYFHERILAKLLGDDTFALAFWNWDNQSEESPEGNVLPELYGDPKALDGTSNNSLYDPERNTCAAPPRVVNFHKPFDLCQNRTAKFQRLENAHLIYTQMVATPVTPSLFFGLPYRFGDFGAVGPGTLETKPHGPVHVWTNFKQMSTFRDSAQDPIFFAHHANVDRLWGVWKNLPGGHRHDLTDSDYLNTEFTFYDEDGVPVSVSVAQSLDPKLLRYEYQDVPTPWRNRGAVEPNKSASWDFCGEFGGSNNGAALKALIASTKELSVPVNFTTGPLTFRVNRTMGTSRPQGTEEILQIQSDIDHTQSALWNAFLFFPNATWDTSESCIEFVGLLQSGPHTGISSQIPPQLLFQVGIEQKLRDMGRDALSSVVITLAGPADQQVIRIKSAKIVYSNL